MKNGTTVLACPACGRGLSAAKFGLVRCVNPKCQTSTIEPEEATEVLV